MVTLQFGSGDDDRKLEQEEEVLVRGPKWDDWGTVGAAVTDYVREHKYRILLQKMNITTVGVEVGEEASSNRKKGREEETSRSASRMSGY